MPHRPHPPTLLTAAERNTYAWYKRVRAIATGPIEREEARVARVTGVKATFGNTYGNGAAYTCNFQSLPHTDGRDSDLTVCVWAEAGADSADWEELLHWGEAEGGEGGASGGEGEEDWESEGGDDQDGESEDEHEGGGGVQGGEEEQEGEGGVQSGEEEVEMEGGGEVNAAPGIIEAGKAVQHFALSDIRTRVELKPGCCVLWNSQYEHYTTAMVYKGEPEGRLVHPLPPGAEYVAPEALRTKLYACAIYQKPDVLEKCAQVFRDRQAAATVGVLAKFRAAMADAAGKGTGARRGGARGKGKGGLEGRVGGVAKRTRKRVGSTGA